MRHPSWHINAAPFVDNNTGDDICDTPRGRQRRHPMLTTRPVTTYATQFVEDRSDTHSWQQCRWLHMRHNSWKTRAAPIVDNNAGDYICQIAVLSSKPRQVGESARRHGKCLAIQSNLPSCGRSNTFRWILPTCRLAGWSNTFPGILPTCRIE